MWYPNIGFATHDWRLRYDICTSHFFATRRLSMLLVSSQASRIANMLPHMARMLGHVDSVRALSTYTLPLFPDILKDIQTCAMKDKLIKVSKLTNLFKTVTSKEQLQMATEALKIFESKHIDPIENTGGEFIKACLKHDAGDVALSVLEQKYRIGLFISGRTFAKLLSYYKRNNDDASIITAFEEMKKYETNFDTISYGNYVGLS
jgi:hypothetical protein